MKGWETARRSADGTVESRSSSTPRSTVRNGAAVRAFLVAGVILLAPCLAVAQSTLAAVYGTVYDEQRGVIPGATITLKNLDTGQVRVVLSDGTGNFRLVGLPPGRYEIQTALAGFVTDVQSDLQLTISAEAERDVILEVEGVSVHETVTGARPLCRDLQNCVGPHVHHEGDRRTAGRCAGLREPRAPDSGNPGESQQHDGRGVRDDRP